MTRTNSDVERVLQLKAQGLTDAAVSGVTGVPIATIRGWRRRGVPRRARHADADAICPQCRRDPHDWEQLPHTTYAYLLGTYLGDGHLRNWGRRWILRISLDIAYPRVIDECRSAIAAIRGRPAHVHPHHSGTNCVDLDSGWVSWPCLLPQHGRGRRTARSIALADWQQRMVDEAPGPFLRGLIHTDGWRGVNKVHVKGHDYEYPRYQFSSRSDDIRRLFCDACDRLGVEWTPWTRYHVSVARRASVALLDRHVGPKT